MNLSLYPSHGVVERKKNRLVTDPRSAVADADATQEYARENPWKAFGIPALAGLIVFLLVSRRGVTVADIFIGRRRTPVGALTSRAP